MSKSEESAQADLTQFEETVDDPPAWSPGSDEETDTGARATCQNCGRTVSNNFARVFGDNDDVVHACPECNTYREMHRGASGGESL